ncbi:MAG TPA: tricarballylate utilization 4Fe-4S protein TcuB [candidate division Zixibacteria bacterium]|nr:tricarballylate utilization 4Fe-4S protein TcuB [candidate division Zixibacteria bacterium]
MLELPMVEEARRQLDICNACRYCEGICAVFPALERRSFFDPGDMVYLANLCHDCRACFEVCPYAPPHELAVDIPKLMSELREKTYAHYAWPRALAQRVDRSLPAAITFSTLAVVAVVVATFIANGWDGMFTASSAPGSFYEVIPWLAMMLPFMAISLVAIGMMLVAGIRFWTDTGRQSGLTLGSLWEAILDVALLRNLEGGGPGCTYPDERPNKRRRIWHSLVFYGFISAFISTVLAAFYQDILGILPPYGYTHPVVIFGTVGGVAMIIGIVGLLSEKRKSDRHRIARRMRTMDLAFIIALLLVNVTGLAVLGLRETAAMPTLLAVHLGYTAALFVTLPYGKFAHAIYRFAALLRNRLELTQERSVARRRPGVSELEQG